MRIKILILLTDLEVGGVPLFVKDLAWGLAVMGPQAGSGGKTEKTRVYEVRVACLAGDGPVAQELHRLGIKTYCLGARGPWDIRVFCRLAKLISNYQPHVLHCCLVHANVVGSIVGRFLDVPHVFSSIHTAERGKLWHLTAENLTCRLSRVTVCVSDSVRRHVERLAHIPAARLHVIPYGINCRRFTDAKAVDLTEIGLRANRNTIIFVGRLDPVKAIDVLLHAMAQLVKEKKLNIQLMIVGEGPERRRLEQLITRLDLDERVCLTGARRDVEKLLKAADIFVLPSRWEGLPIAAVEASAAGLPIVASRTEGLVDVIDHGSTGLLVTPGKASELAQALMIMLNEPNKAKKFGRAAQNKAISTYSLDAMVNNYAQLYQYLISTPKA